jgi:hypothetical protein
MIYGIVDAARDAALHGLIQACPEQVCLFAGKLGHPLDRVAPYLVRLDADAGLTQAWHREGWGQSWGILCQSSKDLSDLRRHFRQFLQAMLPDGQIVLFRFYDPRVFRVYFPTQTPADRVQWFGVVEEYRIETDGGNGTLYCRPGGDETVIRFE